MATADDNFSVRSAHLRIARDTLGICTPAKAPASHVERLLTEIWAEALNLDRVGVDDDLFDLGGDSLVAEEVAIGASAALDRIIQPNDLMIYPTVLQMARFATTGDDPGAPRTPLHVSAQRAGGDAASVFFLHGGLGYFFPRPAFIEAIAQQRPLFIVQTIGLRGEPDPPRSMVEIAQAYLRSIDQTTGERPFHLAAVCAGGDIAQEMACQMADEGRSPLSLTFFDSRAPYRMRSHRSPAWFADARRWVQTEARRLRQMLDSNLGSSMRSPESTSKVEAGKIREGGDAKKPNVFNGEAAAAIRIVDAARRRHTPRRWSGAATIVASEEYAAAASDAWTALIGTVDVRVTAVRHADLFHSQAAATGEAFDQALATADASAAKRR